MDAPVEERKKRGFWDGGAEGHSSNKEASGRPSGFPGPRKPNRAGINTDLEYPDETQSSDK